jgi:hypothetical protein
MSGSKLCSGEAKEGLHATIPSGNTGRGLIYALSSNPRP